MRGESAGARSAWRVGSLRLCSDIAIWMFKIEREERRLFLFKRFFARDMGVGVRFRAFLWVAGKY